MSPSLRRSPLPRAAVRTVLALAQRAQAADGVAPLGEESILALHADTGDATAPEGAVVHLMRRGRGGRLHIGDAASPMMMEDGLTDLVGYGIVRLGLGPSPYASASATAVAEIVVDPTARGRGVGRALVSAADRVATNAGDRLLVWAHGDLPAAQALAAATGLTRVRDLWLMARPVEAAHAAIPVALPPGVTLRPFVPGRDEAAWVTVNARAFADHPEQGRLNRADLAERMRADWWDPTDLLLAERDGAIVGSTWVKADPTTPDTVELYAIGVDPVVRGTGLGAALTAATVRHAAERGARRLVLYVDAANEPAVRLYRAAGFDRTAQDVQYAAPVR